MQEHCYIITSDSELRMWAKSIERRKPLVSWASLLWEMYYEWDECNNQKKGRIKRVFRCGKREKRKTVEDEKWNSGRGQTERWIMEKKGSEGRRRERAKQEREVRRWAGLNSLGWMPRQSVQVLRFSPIYIKAPGTQVQAPHPVKRSSDAEQERSSQLGLRKH